jgi:hypothetical protein
VEGLVQWQHAYTNEMNDACINVYLQVRMDTFVDILT